MPATLDSSINLDGFFQYAFSQQPVAALSQGVHVHQIHLSAEHRTQSFVPVYEEEDLFRQIPPKLVVIIFKLDLTQ